MSGTQLYYDPYDQEIDADPYPMYRRLRDEAPLYHNERSTSGRSAGSLTSKAALRTGSG